MGKFVVSKSIFRIAIGILILISLLMGGIAWYVGQHPSNTKIDDVEYQIWNPVNVREQIKVLGARREFVLSAYGSNLHFGGHYAYTLEKKVVVKRNGKELSSDKDIPKSDYWKIHLYDLDKEGLPVKVIDLNKIVEDYKSGYFVIGFGISEFHNNPKNILAIKVKDRKGDIDVWAINVDTDKIEGAYDERSDTYEEINTIFTYTTLDKYAQDRGYLVQSNISNYTDVNQKQLDTNINLFSEYPESEDKILNDDWTLFPRKQYVTPEEWFDKVLHWMAPKGEDKLTIYGIDSKGQVSDIPLTTYAEYQAWVQKQQSEGSTNETN